MTRYPVTFIDDKMRVDPKVQAGGMDPPERVWSWVAEGETDTIDPPPETIGTLLLRVTVVPERVRTVPVDETVWEVIPAAGVNVTFCGMVTAGTEVKTFLLKTMVGWVVPRETKGVAFPMLTVSWKVREVGPLRVKIPLRFLCPLKEIATAPLNWTLAPVNWIFAGTTVEAEKVT
jgi:hypothetical protein